jgi:hypothetical protein
MSECSAEPSAIARRIELVAGAIAQAHAAAMDDGMTGLDLEISAICEAIQRLGGGPSRQFLPALSALADDLSNLATELVRVQTRTANELTALAKRRRAVAAYRQPSSKPRRR